MIARMLTGVAVLALSAGAAQAQMSDDVIKIGVLNDRSGVYADLGGENSVVAARMAAEEFNNEINGTPIEIVSADHQNKPDIGSNIARQWIDAEAVDAIADVPTSSVALAVQEITRDRDTIFLMSGPAASSLSGEACSPTGFHWTYDTRALAVGTAKTIVENGGTSWFFLTADYAFGEALQADATTVIEELGGEVVGSVRHPLGTSDFSSFLLQAQGSGAQVIGLANAGGDTTNSVKQANEFGITQAGQSLASLLVFLSDVHALGLEAAQGLILTESFYWDLNEDTREWSAAFEERTGVKPTMVHAGVYSGVRHYLRAIQEAGTDEGPAVAEQMRAMPIDDFFAPDVQIQANNRVPVDMHVFQIKSPSESEGPWDYYNLLRTIPGNEAYASAEESGCSFAQ
ncbi:MAG TPA: ABC transporter substrate-binding protein [Alphaproteobacteria bacterium]|nr:ABC transporter substrate-binding protein [Alphaproteobacteria bacterium]